ncbi:MAG: hypothetical protein LV480_04615 [Methylacidiphilales bacterium]|nr:hypothetical protein [Candidatus Methylacidiphilales bacterium]
MKLVLLFALLFLARFAFADNAAPDLSAPSPAPAPQPAAGGASGKTAATKTTHSKTTAAEMQAALDQLTKSNHDLLDLLKQQQAVLEDMQYDRRLQSRRIETLEERLEETLVQNTQLQSKVSDLENEVATHPAAPSLLAKPQDNPPVTTPASTNAAPEQVAPPQPAPEPASETPPPSTSLPPPDSEGAPGTKSWHRLFTLKGEDSQQSDLFQIQGRTWRVLWHNQDKPGKVYVNTSALFINAFPKNDTIPQKVCSKLGSGGDSTELDGPGNYYLKIEASGGSWELAVEDFR